MLELIVQHDVEAQMSDGTVLRADVIRPTGDGQWPVVLTRTPYGKRAPHTALFNALAMARRGYVCIMQDTRHRGTSEGEGEFIPFVADQKDGYDTVEWAAALPYSSGDVYMLGQSYLGFTQWSAAVSRPPSLRAIAPASSPSTPMRTLAFQGGAFELAGAAAWQMIVSIETLMKRHANDPAQLDLKVGALVGDISAVNFGAFSELPLDSFAPVARHDIGEHFFPLMGRDLTVPTLAALESAQEYECIEVPAMIVTGWYDFFVVGSLDQFQGMKARAANETARTRTRLVVGPWTHTNSMGSIAGERNFGPGAAIETLDPDGLSGNGLRFFESLAAPPPGSDAPVKIFVMGANQWRDEQEWPLARALDTSWYLSPATSIGATATAEGGLSPEPKPAGPSVFSYDPSDPVITWGGTNLGLSELSGPRDQTRIEQREDVLVFSTDPLTEPVEVTGVVIVELWVTTDAPDTDFVARLVDVQPDGNAWNLADGILRLRFRNDPLGPPAEQPAEAGKPYLLRIELTPTSNLFKAGHRIRVDVTSSSFPRWARNLNVWDAAGATLKDARVARNSVLHDREHASRVVLPTIPRQERLE